MKIRLFQKADEGYTGWDGEYPTDKLKSEMMTDAQLIAEFNLSLEEQLKKFIDIANRAMMLHYRIKATEQAENKTR